MAGFLSDNGVDLKTEYYHSISVMLNTHVHPQYELYFCADNVRQKSVINGIEYTYKYPCVILSTPYTVHSMSCVEENADSYERYVFYFGEKTLQAFGERLLPRGLVQRNTGLLLSVQPSHQTLPE